MNIGFDSDIYKQRDNRLLLTFNAEYFYNIDSNWGVYLSNTNIVSKNQYLDQPVTIGGNTGLRGFPLQYQHGEHSIKFTSEIRYYPHINLFKLFDLAGAAFIDTGKAFGDSIIENNENKWLYAIGIGARLYSPHSAGSHQVIHIDFAFPQSDNPDIDSFEIRIEAKQSF
jgi:hemolysin activation/secretion protein